jgi:hypothetical protein
VSRHTPSPSRRASLTRTRAACADRVFRMSRRTRTLRASCAYVVTASSEAHVCRYPTTAMPYTQMGAIGQQLRSLLNSNGLSGVRVIGYEHNWVRDARINIRRVLITLCRTTRGRTPCPLYALPGCRVCGYRPNAAIRRWVSRPRSRLRSPEVRSRRHAYELIPNPALQLRFTAMAARSRTRTHFTRRGRVRRSTSPSAPARSAPTVCPPRLHERLKSSL